MRIRLQPLSALGTLTEEEVEVGNCSDRIYVSAHYFTQWLDNKAVTLLLSNAVDQDVAGTMFHAHTKEQDVAYVPDWMLHSLEYDHDMCKMEPMEPSSCTGITLQPHNEEDVEEMELLQMALERYSVVSEGQELTLWHPYGYPFSVRVLSAAPAHPWVSIAQADIPLTMVPPLVVTAAVVPSTVTTLSPTVVPAEITAVAGAGGAVAETTNPGTLRQLCYEAAMRRMEAKEKPE
jgi:hypothetical protein